jgi:hypothetical protein
MSDEKHKSKEVKDEELDKVSGGRSDRLEDMGKHHTDAGVHSETSHKEDSSHLK